MARVIRRLCVSAFLVACFSPPWIWARPDARDLDQALHDRYVGKIFLIRGFLSKDNLKYDSSGALKGKPAVGDWTSDGFVSIEGIHSGARMVILAKRLIVTRLTPEFRLSPAEKRSPDGKNLGPETLKIEVDFSNEKLSVDQVEAVLARVFFTTKDSLADQVPQYWNPCVRNGLEGKNKECLFSSDLLATPGVALLEGSSGEIAQNPSSEAVPAEAVFFVGAGVSPPKAISSPEPKFTNAARNLKYTGTDTVAMIVNAQGIPTDIHILKPLGAGLDANAAITVQSWRFKPAEKDGHPVAVKIAVEVSFDLY